MDGVVPEEVRSQLVVRGLANSASQFTKLVGGRSNALWSFDGPDGRLVCKLYSDAPSPFFANAPAQERAALTDVAEYGLAPKLVDHGSTPVGKFVVYRYIRGTIWRGDLTLAGRALSTVHALKVRSAYPRTYFGPSSVQDIIRSLPQRLVDKALLYCPETAPSSRGRVFLHGDPVPANMIEECGTLRFIDWQSPQFGDPCIDIAVFLSPAMQHLYCGRSLDRSDIATFFSAYGDPEVEETYWRSAHFYHWRLACHCFWRGFRGDPGYEDAAERELSYLSALSA